MVVKFFSNSWYCVGDSVQGASHKRNKINRQDEIGIPRAYADFPLVVSVADGHGGKDYFRSDKGAKIAVDTATEVCQQFFSAIHIQKYNPENNKDYRESLRREIVRVWRERVFEHINVLQPYDDEELERVCQKQKSNRTTTAIKNRPETPSNDPELIPYGSTLLSVVITEYCIAYLQIGDGDIYCINRDGKISRPISKDPNLIGNETTSLCSVEAWSDLEIKIVPIDEQSPPPMMIMLSSDGYANSYPDDTAFQKVVCDYFKKIYSYKDGVIDGITDIGQNLPHWLDEASEGGSGDDISLVLVGNVDYLK